MAAESEGLIPVVAAELATTHEQAEQYLVETGFLFVNTDTPGSTRVERTR